MDDKIRQTTFIALYGAFVSACYLIAYWQRFAVDVFQFAGLTDFAKLAINPLLTAFSASAIGILATEGGGIREALPPGGGTYTPIGRIVNKHRRRILFWGCFISAGLILAAESPVKWFLAALLLLPWTVVFQEYPYVVRLIPSIRLRSLIVTWAFLLPFLALMWGQVNAEIVIGGSQQRVVSPVGIAKGINVSPDEPLGFVGFVGGTYVLYAKKTDSVVLLKQSDTESLTLSPNPAYKSFGELIKIAILQLRARLSLS